jgi:protein associated with RNAse G/E
MAKKEKSPYIIKEIEYYSNRKAFTIHRLAEDRGSEYYEDLGESYTTYEEAKTFLDEKLDNVIKRTTQVFP